MDQSQVHFERAVGDDFIAWYNAVNRTAFAFSGRAGQAPDLVYRDRATAILLVIVTAHYDTTAAVFRWKNLREAADAPAQWGGTNFTESLIANLNHALESKCQDAHERGCILVVDVRAPIATAESIEAILPSVAIPATNRFQGIYITGDFGQTLESTGGYRCWKIT